jgi:hypothetical protein
MLDSLLSGTEEGGYIYWDPETGQLYIVRQFDQRYKFKDHIYLNGDPLHGTGAVMLARFHTHSPETVALFGLDLSDWDKWNAKEKGLPTIVTSYFGTKIFEIPVP